MGDHRAGRRVGITSRLHLGRLTPVANGLSGCSPPSHPLKYRRCPSRCSRHPVGQSLPGPRGTILRDRSEKDSQQGLLCASLLLGRSFQMRWQWPPDTGTWGIGPGDQAFGLALPLTGTRQAGSSARKGPGTGMLLPQPPEPRETPSQGPGPWPQEGAERLCQGSSCFCRKKALSTLECSS